jgi:hypothetical protein
MVLSELSNYNTGILSFLGRKYGTDKVDNNHMYKGLNYFDIYQRYIGPKRFEVKTFVEIGVKDGNSLRVWKEYFPNAIIYGIDIDPNCNSIKEDRIEIIIGDQNDDTFLQSLVEKFNNTIDILLDDGSHITRHQIKTFEYLYPCINKNGFYIIEDLANSYEEWGNNKVDLRKAWHGMKYNKPNDDLKNYRVEFDNFLNTIIKYLDLNKFNSRGINKNLIGIHIYPMIAIFENY